MVRAVDKADAICRRFPALYNIGSHLPFYMLQTCYKYADDDNNDKVCVCVSVFIATKTE